MNNSKMPSCGSCEGNSRLDATNLYLLSAEAVQDARRRRIVPVVLVVCVLSLLMMNSCTSCTGNLRIEGDIAAPLDILGWAGTSLFCVIGLWVIVLAGLLAADHLTVTLEDGSALLLLSRPIAREEFAIARLFGALAVSVGAGAILLGGATFLLNTRGDFNVAPALVACLACLLSSVTVAALSMTVSLYLPRVATFLLVFASVALISTVNLLGLSGAELNATYTAIDQLGPPFATGIVQALASWSEGEQVGPGPVSVSLRLLLWAVGSVVALSFAFRRHEISGSEWG